MLGGIDCPVRQLETEGVRHVLRLEHLHPGLFRIGLDRLDESLRYTLRIFHRAVLLLDLRHELFCESTHGDLLAVPGVTEIHDVTHRKVYPFQTFSFGAPFFFQDFVRLLFRNHNSLNTVFIQLVYHEHGHVGRKSVCLAILEAVILPFDILFNNILGGCLLK